MLYIYKWNAPFLSFITVTLNPISALSMFGVSRGCFQGIVGVAFILGGPNKIHFCCCYFDGLVCISASVVMIILIKIRKITQENLC